MAFIAIQVCPSHSKFAVTFSIMCKVLNRVGFLGVYHNQAVE